MPYLIPSKESLQEFIRSLRGQYDKQSKKALQCANAIDWLELHHQKIDGPNFSSILIGAMLVYSEDPRYRYLHPLLNLGPHHHPNPIPSKLKLIFLSEFLTYANTNKLKLFTEEYKGSLEDLNRLAIKPAVDHITSQPQLKLDVDDLFRKARIVTIESQIAKLPEDYEREKKEHPPAYLSTFRIFDYSKERRKYLQLTNILSTPCINQLLPPNCTTPLSQEHYKYTIRCGFVLYMMQLIKSQEWPMVGDAKKSNFYKICVDIFGTDKLSIIPITEQQIYISNFRDFISRAQSDPFIHKTLTDAGLTKKGQIASFLAAIISNIDTKFQGVVKPLVKGCALASVLSLSQFVIGIQIAKLAASAWDLGYGRGILPSLLAEAGDIIGGPAGRAIATYAGTVYEDAVMPALYAKSLGLGLCVTTGLLFESKESAHAKERRIVQEFTVRLDKDIDTAVIKRATWQTNLEEEMQWVGALANVSLDLRHKLNIICNAHHMMVPICEKPVISEAITESSESKEEAKPTMHA